MIKKRQRWNDSQDTMSCFKWWQRHDNVRSNDKDMIMLEMIVKIRLCHEE